MQKKLVIGLVASLLLVSPLVASADVLDSIRSFFTTIRDVVSVVEKRIPRGSQSAAAALPTTKLSAAELEAQATASTEREVQDLTVELVQNADPPTASAPAPESELLLIAKERALEMQRLATIEPEAFIRNAMPEKARATLPPKVQAEIEKKVTVSGTAEVVHIDDFKNKNGSEFNYHLNVGSTRHPLFMTEGIGAISSGSRLQIRGYQLGQTLVAAADGGVSVVTAASPDSTGVQRVLGVLIKDTGASVPAPSVIWDEIFKGKIPAFFEEQSSGLVSFSGDVTDWITIPYTGSGACGQSVYMESPQVKDYLIQHATDLSSYDHIVFILNQTYGGCASVGKFDALFNGQMYRLSQAWVGWPNEPYQYAKPFTGFEYVFAHEMGHELGVMHANAWYCSDNTLDNCMHNEYGNPFDTMGSGSSGTHFNAFYKDILGWLGGASKVNITETGDYSLVPLELQSGVRAAIVKSPYILALYPSAMPTYLEYRQPIGFDSNVPVTSAGIHINQVFQDSSWSFPFPRLLNANYATPNVFQSALMTGSSFDWPARGISVDALSATSDEATFHVGIGPLQCQRKDFTLPAEYNQLQLTPGGGGYVQLTVVNNDYFGCGPSTFSVSASLTDSTGWYISTYPDTGVTVNPGENAFFSVGFSSPSDAAIGTRELTVTIIDTGNNRSKSIQRTVRVVAPPSITSISPQSGGPGTTVTLSGTNFDHSSYNLVDINRSENNDYYYAVLQNLYTATDLLSFAFPTTFTKIDPMGSNSSVPTPPGTYNVRMWRSTDNAQSNTVEFTVADGLVLTSDKAAYDGGETMSVSWNNPGVAHAKDWIGLVIKDKKWTDYKGPRAKMWFYTDGAKSGTKTMIAPTLESTPDHLYQLVYFVNDRDEQELGRGSPITVTPLQSIITFSEPSHPDGFLPGDVVAVTWKNFTGATVLDWIGAVIENKAWRDYTGSRTDMWFYTKGAVSGTNKILAPEPGKYQFGYFPKDGNDPTYRSGVFSVRTPPLPNSIKSDKSTYRPGDTISVTWHNAGTLKSSDFVTLVKSGEGSGSFTEEGQGKTRFSVTTQSGTKTLVAPSKLGNYQVVYFSSDATSTTELIRSTAFSVGSEPEYAEASYYAEAEYYAEGRYYSEGPLYTQAKYYAQPGYYDQSGYYAESSYYAQGWYEERPLYKQSAYYTQGSYEGQEYSQSEYYSQSKYYSQGNYDRPLGW